MKVASYALSSSAIIFFLIVVADLKGLFTNKCMMYTNAAPACSDSGSPPRTLPEKTPPRQDAKQFSNSKATFFFQMFLIELEIYTFT